MSNSRIIEIEELKQLAFDVLEHLKYVCEKYDIYYFLSFGTTLGAVRHNGFIPWDDDIDVCILRKDYQKLIDAYAQENDSRYQLLACEVDSVYSLPLMKIVDKNTVLIQAGRKNSYPLGVWVDILVLDNVPDEPKKRKRFLKKLEWYQTMWSLIEFLPNKNASGVKATVKNYFQKVVSFLYRDDSRKFALKLEKLAKKYEAVETNEVGVLSFFPYNREKSIFPREMMCEATLHAFEKDEFPIPKEYDAYLKKIYGDYMTPPPVEKRQTHHNYTVAYKE